MTGPGFHLSDQNVHSPSAKERSHKDIWQQVLENGDNNDDSDENKRVLNFLTDNIQRTKPHDTADPVRLSGKSPLTCLISAHELAHAIWHSKTSCPGKSGIKKTVLSHFPDSALCRLREIFNASLSAGYFPDWFKAAEMWMITKAGKPPTRPESYRPNSLPEPTERILCGFLEDWSARIRIADHVGPAFPLDTGLPQGGVLSPHTLHHLHQ